MQIWSCSFWCCSFHELHLLSSSEKKSVGIPYAENSQTSTAVWEQLLTLEIILFSSSQHRIIINQYPHPSPSGRCQHPHQIRPFPSSAESDRSCPCVEERHPSPPNELHRPEVQISGKRWPLKHLVSVWSSGVKSSSGVNAISNQTAHPPLSLRHLTPSVPFDLPKPHPRHWPFVALSWGLGEGFLKTHGLCCMRNTWDF